MAGFLRKKTKPDTPSKSLPPLTPSSPTSSDPPPLFARFATTAQNSNAAASQRIVSSPMALTGRKESVKGGSGMASSNPLVVGSREAEAIRRKTQEQFQASQTSVHGAYHNYSSPIPPSQVVPFRSVSVDKPLPSPIAAGSAPPPAVTRRANSSRAQGPPPTVQPHSLNNARSRASLDVRDLEKKPLPHPGAVQAYYWQEPKSPPPSTYKFTPKTPPKRNGSVSTPATPQIGKMQPLLPAAYGQQGPGLSTPDVASGYLAGQSIPPPISKGPISRQDFPPDNANYTRNGTSNRISMVGSPQTRTQDLRGTPMSDRVLDLPPEVALFQEFSETLARTSYSPSNHQDSPPNILKSTEQVPRTEQQRLSMYREPNKALYKPQPSLPQFEHDTPRRNVSPPLPPPPPASDMGVATSHAAASGILASSYKDFHAPQGSPPYQSVPNSMYGRPSNNNVNQHQHPPASQQQQPPNRSATNSASPPPPLPTGAGLATNYAPFLQGRRSPDASSPLLPPLSHFGTHAEPHFQPHRSSPQPPLTNDLQPTQMGGQMASSFQPAPAQALLHKSPSMQAAVAPLRGKPRIFAAMEEADNGFEQAPLNPPMSYSQPPQPPPPQPQSYHHHQQLPQQHQQTYLPTPPHHNVGSTNGGHIPAYHYEQSHPQELLPSAELFATPKTHPESLPSEFDHSNEGGWQGDRDPRASVVAPSVPESMIQHPDSVLRSSKHERSRSRSRGDEPSRLPQQQQQQQSTLAQQSPARSRKLSKSRPVHPDNASVYNSANGSVTTLPSTPESHTSKIHQHGAHKFIAKAHHQHPLTPVSPQKQPPPVPQLVDGIVAQQQQFEDTTVNSGIIPLDDDPFARVEGVTMLKPTTPPPPREGSIKRQRTKEAPSRGQSSSENVSEEVGMVTGKAEAAAPGVHEDAGQLAGPQKANGAAIPLTPVSPEDYRQWRKEHKKSASSAVVVPPVPVVDRIVHQDIVSNPPREPLTLTKFVADPQLLAPLLAFLTFYDWSVLSSVSREIRILFVRSPMLREAILESYLKTVGYSRWLWDDQEPLSISLQDLSDYMRGVSTPTHEYARVAAMHVHSLTIHPDHRDPSLVETVCALTASARAYSRVILRLRAQAEKEASVHAATQSQPLPPPPSSASLNKANGNFSPSRPGTTSRTPSRAPSPATSMYSYSQQGNAHPPITLYPTASQTSLTFRSPLFRLRRAPLLRVFVPSPEGDWLSDKSVLECEAECKRAGIANLMRLGDVVWDVAVGDEGNVGRLVWDGSYLIDLDYTYSTIGDLPKYLPTLAFPPSYFHRVIRTGAQSTNPIVHVDISPWGEEIALNLQLLQDRVRTETPQGAYHNVVRWVHRSSFTIRPSRGLPRLSTAPRGSPANGRIPIPDSNNLFVDSGWYGTIVVETEGTNEALADLQDRCGPGAFPPRPRAPNARVTQAQVENRKVFRILRERSRPGEIWIKAVGIKERLL